MKRLVVVLLFVAGILFIPSSVIDFAGGFSLTAVADAQEDRAQLTVYVTRTGERYHVSSCRYLRQSKIATTLRDAVNRGFGPCSVHIPLDFETTVKALLGTPPPPAGTPGSRKVKPKARKGKATKRTRTISRRKATEGDR